MGEKIDLDLNVKKKFDPTQSIMVARKEFPDDVIDAAWNRARQGKKNLQENEAVCESNITDAYHPNSCKILKKEQRGNDNESGGWEAHHINPNGEPILDNCQILCCKCHKQTPSYGKHSNSKIADIKKSKKI